MKTILALAALVATLTLFASAASAQYVVREREPSLAEKWGDSRYDFRENVRRQSPRMYDSMYGDGRNQNHLSNIPQQNVTQCTQMVSGDVICHTY